MTTHLAFPIRVTASGLLASVEHGSDADISQSIALLLDTRPGERRSEPDYGLPDPVFGGAIPAHVADVITTWEDRADLTTVEQLVAGITQQITVATGASPDDYEIDTSDDTEES